MQNVNPVFQKLLSDTILSQVPACDIYRVRIDAGHTVVYNDRYKTITHVRGTLNAEVLSMGSDYTYQDFQKYIDRLFAEGRRK